MSNTIGRNDPCVCGSGKKYKRCCLEGDQSATGTASRTIMIVLGVALVIGLVFMVVSMFSGGGGGACPPGQSFDVGHGHCH